MSLTTDRRTYIGGSDIVAIMGLQSQYEYANWTAVWNKFVSGETEPFDEQSGHMQRGNILEPVIERYIREYVDESINDYRQFISFDEENDIEDLSWDPLYDGGNPWNTKYNCRTQIFVRDHTGRQPYLGGHVDGIGSRPIYEMKAPALHNIEYMQRYGCKYHYLIQDQYYMMLTGRTLGFVYVWDYDSWSPLVFRQYADEDLWQKMRQTTDYFWKCVEQKEVPSLKWQKKMGYEHYFSLEELNTVLEAVYEARERKKKWTAVEKKLKPALMTAVRAIWPEGDPKTQFSTSKFLVSASEYMRGESLVTKLSIKENGITKEVQTAT